MLGMVPIVGRRKFKRRHGPILAIAVLTAVAEVAIIALDGLGSGILCRAPLGRRHWTGMTNGDFVRSLRA
jgi:hypothetical protein